MRWRCEIFCFSEAETAKVEAERGLLDGFIMQVATEDPSDEGGREVVKIFKQLLAKVATILFLIDIMTGAFIRIFKPLSAERMPVTFGFVRK